MLRYLIWNRDVSLQHSWNIQHFCPLLSAAGAAIAFCIPHSHKESLHTGGPLLLFPIPTTTNTFCWVMRKKTEVKTEFQNKVYFLFIDWNNSDKLYTLRSLCSFTCSSSQLLNTTLFSRRDLKLNQLKKIKQVGCNTLQSAQNTKPGAQPDRKKKKENKKKLWKLRPAELVFPVLSLLTVLMTEVNTTDWM